VHAVNRALIQVYWQIGRTIAESQEKHHFGKSVVEELAKDLKRTFPDQTGFSPRNLWDMRRFYITYKSVDQKLRQAVAEIPWGHHLVILQKAKDENERTYYIKASREMRWSRNVLLNQIKADAYQRHRVAPKQNNFESALPQHISEQANEAIKSQYSLEFLGINELVLEKDLEARLLSQLQGFLLELGVGFTFVGSQYPLVLGEKTYRVDLLFFHRHLDCLIALELKIGGFKPEYSGKMNFYLELLDEQVKLPKENPSIGIILCAEKDDLAVEYALRTSSKPVGVAKYTISNELPEELKGKIPSPESLKKRLKQ